MCLREPMCCSRPNVPSQTKNIRTIRYVVSSGFQTRTVPVTSTEPWAISLPIWKEMEVMSKRPPIRCAERENSIRRQKSKSATLLQQYHHPHLAHQTLLLPMPHPRRQQPPARQTQMLHRVLLRRRGC